MPCKSASNRRADRCAAIVDWSRQCSGCQNRRRWASCRVMFTGSGNRQIHRAITLNRNGAIAFLIAETDGQNTMIVDSSALAGKQWWTLPLPRLIAQANVALLCAYSSCKKKWPIDYLPCWRLWPELTMGNPRYWLTISAGNWPEAQQMLLNIERIWISWETHCRGKITNEAKVLSLHPAYELPDLVCWKVKYLVRCYVIKYKADR